MESLTLIWMGAFTRLEVLIVVRECSGDCQLFFEIGNCVWM